MIEIPEWMACADLIDRKEPLNKLQRFVYDFEPSDDLEREEWREQLKGVLEEAVAILPPQAREAKP